MDIGVEKVSNHLVPLLFQLLKRVNGTVGTTDM
jgi:hypothetical protein